MSNINLLDIDKLVFKFLEDRKQGISSLHRMYFKNDDRLSLLSLIEELKDELKTGCVSFINKNRPMEELDTYLFYIVNSVCRSHSNKQKKKTEYVCPGCLFVGKETPIFFYKFFNCEECEESYKSAKDPKWIEFYNVFKKHNKSGYRCHLCSRFIPQSLLNKQIISCPYIDCAYVGDTSSLKKMHHPTIESNAEILSLDADKSGFILKDNILSTNDSALSVLENKEIISNQISLIKEIIESQNNNTPYSSSNFTIKHKQLVYSAFNKLLDQYPEDMVNYLLNNSRSGGFQHKIFQEYILGLENSLPFLISKNKKMYKISSLTDSHLGLFDGISYFESTISNNLEIKNNTQEFYIGNRKGSYAKPYYIGKLLSVINKETGIPIINNVVEYTFNKIKMKNVDPGTPVLVSHLRVFPHYQMGGMVYVNRIRKKIIDRARILSHK